MVLSYQKRLHIIISTERTGSTSSEKGRLLLLHTNPFSDDEEKIFEIEICN